MLIVLAIENADLRLAIELLLNEEPGVEIVGSASESVGLLALVKSSRPDLVIFSWGLPECPSKNILDDINGLEDKPAILVIGDSLHERELALKSDANAFVTKGESPDLLLGTFRRLRKEEGFSSTSKEVKE